MMSRVWTGYKHMDLDFLCKCLMQLSDVEMCRIKIKNEMSNSKLQGILYYISLVYDEDSEENIVVFFFNILEYF